MTTNGDKSDSRPHIELENTAPQPTPKYILRSDAVSGEFDPDALGDPIPERPLHLCPCCDYNLTGMRSRRCPECGEPFNIRDARHRAIECSQQMREDRIATYIEYGKPLALLGIFAAGVLWFAWEVRSSSTMNRGLGGLAVGIRGSFVLLLLANVLFTFAVYRLFLDYEKGISVLAATLFFINATALCFLFL